jgi:hypothetical protein
MKQVIHTTLLGLSVLTVMILFIVGLTVFANYSPAAFVITTGIVAVLAIGYGIGEMIRNGDYGL